MSSKVNLCSLVTGAGVLMGSCYAMEYSISTWDKCPQEEKAEIDRALNGLYHNFMKSFTCGECMRAFMHNESADFAYKASVDAIRRDLVLQFCDAERACNLQKLAKAKPACEVLQVVWRSAQTAMGIAYDQQLLLLVDDSLIPDNGEFGVLCGRAIIREVYNTLFLERDYSNTWVYCFMRASLMHEAAHIKLNHDKLHAAFWERACTDILSDSEIVFSAFIKALQVDALPFTMVEDDLVVHAIEKLQKIDVNMRLHVLACFFKEWDPPLVELEKHLHYDGERGADALLLEKLACADCMKTIIFVVNKFHADKSRVRLGYASIGMLEARAHELELAGKMCALHAKTTPSKL